MKELRTSIAVCLLALGTATLAQNEDDALRYSITMPGGTARAWGLAGAMGAVGADPAAATINPAGFGLYNTSEFSLTLGLESNTAKAAFYSTAASASRQRMSVNNLGLVFSYRKNNSDWRGGTFGVSYDRQASFQRKELASADRVPGTFLDQFVLEANGIPYTDLENGGLPFTAGLAWYTYGIDTMPGSTDQYLPGIPSGSDTRQQHTIDASGRMGTTSLFYATNYKDKLYIGFGLGLTGTRYERYTTHDERVLDENADMRTVRYKEDLLTTGNGLNVKLGVIGRAGPRVRLGAAFHSPVWLLLSDAYSYTMTTSFNGGGDPLEEVSPDGTFSYRVTTPWSAVLSAVYQAGKYGLVSVDYTYSDPRNARLRASRDFLDEYDYASENGAIKDSFSPSHTVRAGTEWRAGSWYFRVGGAWRPDPYTKADTRRGTSYRQYTGGLGYRVTHWSFDLAGAYGLRDGKYYTYSPALVAPVSASYTDLRVLLTVAWRP